MGLARPDLLREFPSIAEDPKRSPWSVMPVPTDRFLELNFSQHGLVVYDPDGPALYPPDRPARERGLRDRSS